MAKITLIGSGKAATALGIALYQSGNELIQVWSRNQQSAAELANKLNANPTNDLKAVTAGADIYIIAIKDDAIELVAKQLHIGDKIIAHTSGIQSKAILTTVSANYGIFYPFVSMTKETATDFKAALFMVEGSNDKTTEALDQLAHSISGNVKIVEEKQRQSLHLAAVFAHNFTNHLYIVAEKLLADKGLIFNDLRPLIAAHTASVLQFSPAALQTGPAIRHDNSTIDKHLQLLDGQDDLRQLYSTITAAIQQWHKTKYE